MIIKLQKFPVWKLLVVLEMNPNHGDGFTVDKFVNAK